MFDKIKGAFKGFTEKISKKTLSEKDLDKNLNDLKINLIRNDVAYQATEEICNSIKQGLTGEKVGRLEKTKNISYSALKNTLLNILTPENPIDLLKLCEEKNNQGEPLILLFLGINGTGKTTTIAKLVKYFQKHKYSCVLAAADTFRAGSIEQLGKHANNLNVRIIKHDYGSDPASVAFDAINHATSKKINIVLIDTAGRMETNKNLMAEMDKICRVAEPDLKIFVASLLVGNDAYEQIKIFNDKIGIDASILNMADADVKGGAIISVAYVSKKPILFLGNGQSYDDLIPFEPEKYIEMILK
ncbi:MAG: signal recognition particle-docking protein FtsY [Candidatus Helarchaeota archaeon]